MQEDFDYKDVPKGFLHCLDTKCTHSATCLHFLAAQHAEQNISSFLVVNPVYVANRDECQFFQTVCLARFALGITHLFNNLQHAKAVKIKAILYNYFGRNTFYRIRSKQRLIKPEEQDFIRKVFIEEEIADEPIFDEYVDRYNWY